MLPNQPPSSPGAETPAPARAELTDARTSLCGLPSFQSFFDEEHRVYEAHKAELLQEHEGQFVVIKGDEIVGIRATYEAALEVGYDRFFLGPFFVKEILKEDPVILVTRFILSCPT